MFYIGSIGGDFHPAARHVLRGAAKIRAVEISHRETGIKTMKRWENSGRMYRVQRSMAGSSK